MTIAEKITRAKADYDEVYNAGYTKGKAEGGGGYEQGVADGIEQGKQEKSRSLMAAIQQGGERTAYNDMFSAPYWTDENFAPIYDIRTSNGAKMFNECGITDLRGILERQGVELDTSGTGNFSEFMKGSTITHSPVIDASAAAQLSQAFYNCQSLISIEKLIISSTGDVSFSHAFYACYALVQLVIEGVIGKNGLDLRYSQKLSKASITSIINALSTTTTGLTVTLSKTAVDNAFATSEGLADGSNSEEWLALIATRQNWTISLV